jgi:hypothetical protein
VLTFISDAGHGWLAVPMDTYPDALQYGTGWGYVDRAAGMAYLEEDCEAPAFMRAHGLGPDDVRLEYVYGDWPGRGLPRLPERMKV